MALLAVGKESARLGSVGASALADKPAVAITKGQHGIDKEVGKTVLGKQII